MERKMPRNVRQIGNVSGTPKIFVEDYVVTFFSQLREKAGDQGIGAFLVGEFVTESEQPNLPRQPKESEQPNLPRQPKESEQPNSPRQPKESEQPTTPQDFLESGEMYVYIYGAIQMHTLKFTEKGYVLDEETWQSGYEDCKLYFENGEILGWFVAQNGLSMEVDEQLTALHREAFPKENTILIQSDPEQREDRFYVYKFHDLLEMGGHYTYYEKNPDMQNYMISARRKNGVCPTEAVEDRAAKDFRSIVRTRGEQKNQRATKYLTYALRACLVLLIIVSGAMTFHNYNKMRAVQAVLTSGNVQQPVSPQQSGIDIEGN